MGRDRKSEGDFTKNFIKCFFIRLFFNKTQENNTYYYNKQGLSYTVVSSILPTIYYFRPSLFSHFYHFAHLFPSHFIISPNQTSLLNSQDIRKIEIPPKIVVHYGGFCFWPTPLNYVSRIKVSTCWGGHNRRFCLWPTPNN